MLLCTDCCAFGVSVLTVRANLGKLMREFLSRDFLARKHDQTCFENGEEVFFWDCGEGGCVGNVFVPREYFYVLGSPKGFPKPEVESKAKVTNRH